MKDDALTIARHLNDGRDAITALAAVGLTQDDVWGEDQGDDCMSVEDPYNNVIDLGWHESTSYRVRRLSIRQPWQVEVMQRFADDGSLLGLGD